MTGISAFLYEVPFMLGFGIVPLFVVAWYVGVWLRLGRLPASGMRAAVFMLATLAVGIVVVNNFAHEFYFQYTLRSLEPAAVQSIQVDQTVFTDTNSISALVTCIRQAQWFTSNHGGWDRPVALVIRTRSGQTFDFSVANYARKNGSVIHFNSAIARPGLHFFANNGSAFEADLSRVLRGLGVNLPGYNGAGVQR
ncbi:MAG: hypothetical protein ACLPVW_17940 [Terriglobales bacterium]|jgi:hypothetical protein